MSSESVPFLNWHRNFELAESHDAGKEVAAETVLHRILEATAEGIPRLSPVAK